MKDYMLLEYLRNHGTKDDYSVIEDFKRYMHDKKSHKRHRDHSDYDDMSEDTYKSRHYSYDSSEEHFEEYDAKELVDHMYHYEMNRRVTGEHFDMHKAVDVYNKHKDSFIYKACPEDVYVAINATYHDFYTILKSWFGTTVDEKLILLAVTFWFKDDDYQGNKLMDYFE